MSNSIYGIFSPKKTEERPEISRFTIERDSSFIGYRTRLRWIHENSSIIGFKVWKSISKKVLLKKSYDISQAALERTTGLNSREAKGTALYNKSFYSQNSKVKFENSNTDRYDKKDEVIETDASAEFMEIGFINKNSSGQYEFVDKRVKFGETYYYCISAVNIDFFESNPSDPVEVSIEDTRHPDSPSNIQISYDSSSVILTIKNNKKAEDIEKYKIYRREEDQKDFVQIAEVKAEGDNVVVSDSSVFPSVRYFYKVYSVDFFNNISFSSEQYAAIFSSFTPLKDNSRSPDFDIIMDSNQVIIKGIKNDNYTTGHKIERQDSWRFEQGFNLKSYNSVDWQNNNTFNSSGSYEFIDRTVGQDRIYKYRVSSVSKNGQVLKNVVTPFLIIKNGFSASFRDGKQLQTEEVKIIDFNVSVDDKKEFPIFTKMQWAISGSWSYLNLEIEKLFSTESVQENDAIKLVKIDNIHNYIYYEGLEEGNTYAIRLRVFDIDDDLVATTDFDSEVKIVL